MTTKNKKFNCEGGFDCKKDILEKVIENLTEENENLKTIIKRKNFELDELRKQGL